MKWKLLQRKRRVHDYVADNWNGKLNLSKNCDSVFIWSNNVMDKVKKNTEKQNNASVVAKEVEVSSYHIWFLSPKEYNLSTIDWRLCCTVNEIWIRLYRQMRWKEWVCPRKNILVIWDSCSEQGKMVENLAVLPKNWMKNERPK